MRALILIIFLSGAGVACAADSARDPDNREEAYDRISKALANWPAARDTRGFAVQTSEGVQLTPAGTMPKEIDINQQIFNDIDRLREKMLDYMVDVTNMGTRYNLSSDFDLVKVRLKESLTQLENALKLKLKR